MTTNTRITHFRVVKNACLKKNLRSIMKSIINGSSSPTDHFPVLTDTHNARVQKLELAPKGGVTVVYDETTGDSATAVCGLKEHFSRRKGRDIATGRLAKKRH